MFDCPLRMVHVRCGLCDADQPETLALGEDFEYRCGTEVHRAVRCTVCGHVYLNPRPHEDEMARIYPPSYHAFNFSAERFGLAFKVRRYLESRRLLRYCEGMPADGRVLDVGCGDGFHLQLLRDFGKPGWTLEGVDASSQAVAAGKQAGLTIQHGRLEALNLPDSYYDRILLIQTIEHLGDPAATLSAIRRVLKPGGSVTVVTDNVRSLDATLFRGRHWGGYHFPRHWNLFSEGTLRKLASRVALTPMKISTIVSPVNWVYSVRNWLQDSGAPAWVYERWSLSSPATLAAFTLADCALHVLGRGALLCATLQRPTT